MLAAVIYAFIWLLVMAAALVFYLTGNLNSTAQIAFGFVFTTLTFMGLIGVLPSLMNDYHASKVRQE